jgi:uncharacterized membrane protein
MLTNSSVLNPTPCIAAAAATCSQFVCSLIDPLVANYKQVKSLHPMFDAFNCYVF